MYMYYLLGYRSAIIEKEENLSNVRKEIRDQNTFILALDGDIDFLPEAVVTLVDSMKRNPATGAACGRIHPVGSPGFSLSLSLNQHQHLALVSTKVK